MSGSNTNHEISLEANSIYITTSQLTGRPGIFHWSFFLTDAAGTATKHHWAQIRVGEFPKSYQTCVVNPVSTYSTNSVATFAYLKVCGFVSPGGEAFTELAGKAFTEDIGFKTVRDIRFTCRTWILTILCQLKKLGYLKREETEEWFEEQVKKCSIVIEERSEGGLQKSFVGEI
jgi:hypothetical protein